MPKKVIWIAHGCVLVDASNNYLPPTNYDYLVIYS